MSVSPPLVVRLRERFAASAPELRPRAFFAPGRANLLGAHMDYNGGCVLPVALSRGTYALAALRSDGMLRASSEQFPEQAVALPLAALRPGRARGWSAYLEGAVWSTMRAWGPLPGLEVQLSADLPMAKGLSSSASVECVTVYALARLLGRAPADDACIQLAHAAETEYVGVRCGLLDQTAIWLGRADSVLHFDCLARTSEHLPLNSERALVAVMDSGLARDLVSSAFNRRVAECAEALALLRGPLPEVRCLRDVAAADLERLASLLPGTLLRRVRHVVAEHRRTQQGAAALRAHDLAAFGRLMLATHASLRDLYEVSTPELDALTAVAAAVPGCWGARLTGAGFGGCVVALVEPAARAEFTARVPRDYRAASGRDTEVMWFSPSAGPRELPLGG